MPIYVGYTQKRRTVRLLSAGENQYVLCPEHIDLSAVVSDETNLRNYSLLWEQLEGSPADLEDPTALNTSFPHAVTDDKKFRFTLDSGTNQEQSKEVTIYYTPLSDNGLKVTQPRQSYIQQTIPNLTTESTFTYDIVPGEFNDDTPTLNATKFSFDPTSVNLLAGSLIKIEVLGTTSAREYPSILLDTYLAVDFPSAIRLPRGIYVFRFYYTVNSKVVYFDSPLMISNSLYTKFHRAIHDIVGFGRTLGQINDFEKHLPTPPQVGMSVQTLTPSNFGVIHDLFRASVALQEGQSEVDFVPVTFGVITNLVRLDQLTIGS